MRRDMDLVRELLFRIAANEDLKSPTLGLSGRGAAEVAYHLALMQEAGLILAVDATALDATVSRVLPLRLTWAGHDFLDASKNEQGWAAVRAAISKLGGLTFDLAKEVLVSHLRSELKLPR